LATDQRARYNNEKLGSEYREIAEELKSISSWESAKLQVVHGRGLELARYSREGRAYWNASPA
jgi:hypothetical protein